jgi:hypothetical protein
MALAGAIVAVMGSSRAFVVTGSLIWVVSAGWPLAQAPPQGPPQTQTAQPAPAVPPTHVFASDAGMVLNFVKPDKAAEPAANGSVLYVFVMDPVVSGSDYTVSAILAEAFPYEVQSLDQKYAGAYAGGQNFVNLRTLSAFGEPLGHPAE